MSDIKYLNDNITLNDEQIQLRDKIIRWYKLYTARDHSKDEPGRINRLSYFTYSGPAGSGKTTVMRQAIEALGLNINTDVACAAYVGKAVMVMKMNGLDAKTIHSLIYDAGVQNVHDDVHNRWIRKWKFTLKSKEALSKYKLIFCDEAAMIPDSIFKDLMSFGIPIIFAGDCNQLPPVMSTSDILSDPNFILTKVMRQAEDNPIIHISQKILNNEYIQLGNYGNSRVLRDIHLGENLLNDYDVILTNTLRLREGMNRFIRKNIIGLSDLSSPHIGEKMICRSKVWDFCIDGYYLVNGMVGTVVDTYGNNGKSYMIDFLPDVFESYKGTSKFYSKVFWGIKADEYYLKASLDERKEIQFSRFTKMEYAYAINVHVAQGSQYNRVLYLNDPFSSSPDMMKKLTYILMILYLILKSLIKMENTYLTILLII